MIERVDPLESAIDLYREGRSLEAEAFCERHLALSADDPAALSLLADIRLSSGRFEESLPALRQLTRLYPGDGGALHKLGVALLSTGRPMEAIEPLQRAIELEPRSARVHNDLGQALARAGRIEAAAQSFRVALQIDPGDAITRVNLGIALEQLGRYEEAMRSYDQALALSPSLVGAWVGRGTVLIRQQRFESALDSFEKALHLRPGDAALRVHQASALLALERPADALRCAEEAVGLRSDLAAAHNVKAGALRKLHQYAAALPCLDRALELDPADLEAWCNRGVLLSEMGDSDAAAQSYRRALELNPDHIRARTRLLASLIPAVPASAQEVLASRQAFETELSAWERVTGALSADQALKAAQQTLFYLSYQEDCNRTLLVRFRRPLAERLADFLPAPRPDVAAHSVAPRRFRLGFVSAHVFDHSVYTAIVAGWLRALDRARFELTLFNVGTKEDVETRHARQSVDHFETGPRSVPDWARLIHDRALDALIFPEVGMNDVTLGLASLRLCRYQLAAWGHPETSGFPTIDGFLSADRLEPPDAQDHYCEQLVRLPNLGVHYEPHEVTSSPADLTALGPRPGPLFLCAGVPFKYAPQHDRIFVEIARRLGPCRFLFFQHDKFDLSRRVLQRISVAFRGAGLDPARHLVLMPWQSRASFFGLLRSADVYLDTIGFSGFNTLMQAVECRLPCVAFEGRFLRGRLGSGILRHLGLDELVATGVDAYIDLATRLAESSTYRAAFREKLGLAASRAYRDVSAVDALARVLLEHAAVACRSIW
jgi:predicted O-linked N-acetylglucosamine transferase (SPINDLY family)